MIPSDQTVERQFAPATFSLGTLFLFLTAAGVGSVAFRLPGHFFWFHASIAVILAGVFLIVWFAATWQFKRLRLAGALVAFGLISYAFISPGVTARQDAQGHAWAYCGNQLRQIGLALLNYHDAYGSFPPEFVADRKGQPLYSWRVLILPYLEDRQLANSMRYNEAWNGPNNAKIVCGPIFGFSCPEDPNYGLQFTNYLAVAGPHAAWTGAKPRSLSDFKNPSKTVLVVEVANSRINWAEPRDLDVGQMSWVVNSPTGVGISSGHEDGAWVLFADGHTEFLPDSTDLKKLAEMLDIDATSDQAKPDSPR